MLLKFLTVAQKNFEIEVDESETISEVKKKVFKKQGEGYEPETVRLILSGKILDDKKTVLEYKDLKIGEAKIIAMGKNKKAELEKSKKEQQLSHMERSKNLKSSNSASLSKTALPKVKGKDEPPSDLEELIQGIMALGIPREHAIFALKECQYNPDVAANFIFQSHLFDENTIAATQTPSNPNPTTVGESTPKLTAPNNPLDILSEHPKFPKLCDAIAQNPSLIIPLLGELGNQSLSTLNYVTSHPDEFYEVVMKGRNHTSVKSQESVVSNTDEYADSNTQTLQLDVSPTEKEAIDRICRMGFDFPVVLQAYFAFEKNEALTVDFLVNNEDPPNNEDKKPEE